MGAGKTSVGRVVAHRLCWQLSDSDEEIQSATGKSVRELASGVGVDAMHAFESEHLLKALDAAEVSVVCAAAAVVDDARCRDRLSSQDVLTVWLRAKPATLADRFSSSDHRPAYGDDPAAFLADQLSARSHLFEEVSGAVIDVDDLSIEAAAGAVLAVLQRTESANSAVDS